jgi:hypothetical protein
MGIKGEGGLLHGLIFGVISGWRRKTMTWPDSGTHTSAREEGIGWGTNSVFFLGCGLLPFTRPKSSPGPFLFLFLLFSFSFFVFLN